MEQTTEGTFRVHPGRDDGEWLLLDVESGDPVYVPRDGPASEFEPGSRVRAELAFADGDARVTDAAVVADTRLYFYRTDEELFEAARACWRAASEAGEPMASRVTHDTDSEPNGVVYTFAEQPGRQDLFAEFRDGAKPLEPLVERATEGAAPPFEVFVLDHADHPFVVVYIALERDGLLARTVRETYGDAALTDLGGVVEQRSTAYRNSSSSDDVDELDFDS